MWGLITFTFHIFMLIVSSFETDILNLRKNIVVLENDLAIQKNLNSVLRDHVTEKGLYHSRTRKAANCSIQPVVFHARLASNIYPLGSNQIIAYDSVITNEGNAYDTLTLMFEATSTGLYQFIATMWSSEGRNLDFQMIFNGGEVCAGRTTTTNQSMGICSAILQVPAGGRVFIRHKSTNGNPASPAVAFSAYLSTDVHPVASYEAIIYNTVNLNEGDAYNAHVGRFKAPVAGIYHFVASVQSYSSDYIDFELVRDGSYLCRGRGSRTYESTGTCASTVHLNLGSDVWVRHYSTYGNYIKGSGYSSFTGHLVHAD